MIYFGYETFTLLETTIPSYLVSRPSRDLVVAGRQEITRQWWDARKADFRIVVSQVVSG